MTQAAGSLLFSDLAGACRGVVRLARFDPEWHQEFDFSTAGFLRSFAAPLFGLPCAMTFDAALSRLAGRETEGAGRMVAELFGYGLGVIAFPVIVALIARPFRLGHGYAALIVTTNWIGLFLNLFLAIAGLAALLAGIGVLQFLGLIVAFLQVFLVWRTAKETLTGELAVTLMIVVLWVALETGIGQLTYMLGRAL